MLNDLTVFQKQCLVKFFHRNETKIDMWLKENPGAKKLPIMWSKMHKDWVWLGTLIREEKHALYNDILSDGREPERDQDTTNDPIRMNIRSV